MFIFNNGTSSLASYVREEIEFDGDVARGDRGKATRRAQEWLRFHGATVVKVDGKFGGITEESVASFQQTNGLTATGVVDEATFGTLVAPMIAVLRPPIGPIDSFGEAMAAFAEHHHSQSPREIGRANCGPWVRLYMRGNQGAKTLWCAGFVTFCMKQAAEFCEVPTPIRGTASCDQLASQAKKAGLFLHERDATPDDVPRGSIYLRRKSARDWNHTGVVTDSTRSTFSAVEGNTNARGHRDADRVWAHTRPYTDRDFVIL